MKSCQIFRASALAAILAFPLANCSFGATIGVNLTNTVTATMDQGIAKGGDAWYKRGVNGAAVATGIQLGLVAAQYNPFSDYLFQPASGMNALMLDAARTTGTLTFNRPISVTGLSLAGASGNGTGTNLLTLHFSDATTSTLSAIVGDWFFLTNSRVQTANGRINIFNNAGTTNPFENVNSDNPRIYAVNMPLATADQLKFLTSIDFSWVGSSTNAHTAIFGVSGDVTGIGHYTAIPLTPGSFNQDLIVGMLEVPEPGTIALVGLGAACLLARRKKS